ncbi:MAG: hypothetical protein J6S79_03400 [Lachnospiraceae bacterium]|nr:hypothetical protein [Lachnospiraceae bacterium]
MKRKIACYVVLFSFLICAGIWLLWDRHKSPGDGSEANSQEDLISLYIPDDIVRIELVNNATREKRVIIRNRESIQEICGELRAFAGEKADISGEEQPRYTVYCYRDKSTKCTEIRLISEDACLIPKQRLSGGMTVQEVIDFFEAWRNWSRFY